jgi:hypothetical protein
MSAVTSPVLWNAVRMDGMSTALSAGVYSYRDGEEMRASGRARTIATSRMNVMKLSER